MISLGPSRAEEEKTKYEDIWSFKAYNKYSPGERFARIFSEMVTEPDCTILDIGCGSGKGGLALRDLGYDVTFFDIAKIGELEPFIQAPVWSDWPRHRPTNFDYGFCCDVLEHIPTEYMGLSIHQILKACDEIFFSIGLERDSYGDLIKAELHLTIRPYIWWRDFLQEFGELKDARDLGTNGLYWLSR